MDWTLVITALGAAAISAIAGIAGAWLTRRGSTETAKLTADNMSNVVEQQIEAARASERVNRLRDLRAERIGPLRQAITEFREAAGRFVLIDFANEEETRAAGRRVVEASTMITAHVAPAGVVGKWGDLNRALTELEDRTRAGDDEGIPPAAVKCVALTEHLDVELDRWVVDTPDSEPDSTEAVENR